MRRKLGILAGLLAAVGGTLVLMSVVENTDQETAGNSEVASILVVKTLIPRQTSGEQIALYVEITEVPLSLVSPGAISTLEDIPAGLATSTDLLPGEQLLIDRFVDPRVQTRVVVPVGLQEVTVAFEVPQALGGALVAGDTVGIVASFDTPAAEGSVGSATTFLLHKVLITSVQFSSGDAAVIQQSIGGGGSAINQYPVESLMVTFAVSSNDAARVVFSAEFGRLWLTKEGASATIDENQELSLDDFVVLQAS